MASAASAALAAAFSAPAVIALLARRDLVLHRIDHVLAPRQALVEGFSDIGWRLELFELGKGILTDRGDLLAQFDYVLFFRRVSELQVYLCRLGRPLVADRVRLSREILSPRCRRTSSSSSPPHATTAC